jgi:hypothetical protein
LAYPNPSRETFEQRLFVPFQEAMPPPPHYHPGMYVDGCCGAMRACVGRRDGIFALCPNKLSWHHNSMWRQPCGGAGGQRRPRVKP